MKDYLIKLLEACAPENGFAQDAIDHAIFNGTVKLSLDLAKDQAEIMERYDEIITKFKAYVAKEATHPLIDAIVAGHKEFLRAAA